MTKVIAVIVIALILFGGYKLWDVWDTYNRDQDLKQKAAEQSKVVPENLPGMPSRELEDAYRKAQERGASGIEAWLKAYGNRVEDPRRAWIELDYVVAVTRDNPAEAKKVFADVKARTPQSSPVYPRVKELEKAYE